MRLLKNDNNDNPEKKQIEMLIDGKGDADKNKALKEIRDMLENKHGVEKDKANNIIAKLDIQFTKLENLTKKNKSPDPVETMVSFINFMEIIDSIAEILDEAETYYKR